MFLPAKIMEQFLFIENFQNSKFKDQQRIALQ
jgi:hypothetical protein